LRFLGKPDEILQQLYGNRWRLRAQTFSTRKRLKCDDTYLPTPIIAFPMDKQQNASASVTRNNNHTKPRFLFLFAQDAIE
jgi:hypothetical protein